MKKFSIASSILGVVFFFLGCEGSFEPGDVPPDTPFQINLIAPPNQEQCLTQGDDGNGNWRVQFDWTVTSEFDGDFTIVLTANGEADNSQNLSPGGELILSANTLYTWQIQADGREEESDIFTFVTPATPDEPTSPPVISTINIEQAGEDYLISCSVLDVNDDLDQVQLFINNNQTGITYEVPGNLEWIVDNLPNGAEIRVVAIDNFGHVTEQTRLFSN